MANDNELLRDYALEGCEGAFTELVHRRINLVYSAALREMAGNSSLAEDITQAVFLELARKAASLWRHPALAGWLYTCVRGCAANLRRAEARRQRRELQAHAMNDLLRSEPEHSLWSEIARVLDDAMHELREKDRVAVVLRFFEQRTIEEVGLALGLNKGAAHMRIDRALEKLRELLRRRGVTSTASVLGAALTDGASLSAPQWLAASVSAGVFQAASSGSSTLITLKILTMTKLKIGIVGALIVAGIATPVAMQYRELRSLRQQNQSMRQELLQQNDLAEENRALSNRVAEFSAPKQTQRLPRDDQSELLRLRSEVTHLRSESLRQKATLAAKPAGGKTRQTGNTFQDQGPNAVLIAQEQDMAFKMVQLAQQAATNNGAGADRALNLAVGEDGKPHLMQMVGGKWTEVPQDSAVSTPAGTLITIPEGNMLITPEGAMTFSPSGTTNPPTPYQTRYVTLTNSPSQ